MKFIESLFIDLFREMIMGRKKARFALVQKNSNSTEIESKVKQENVEM